MKYLFSLVLVSILFIFSCSKNNEVIETKNLSVSDYPQTWKLVKMTGSLAGWEAVGEEMDWQENYVFKSDGSFVKIRISKGETKSATGNYTYSESTQSFILSYEKPSEIIGSCGINTSEHLYFDENEAVLLSNWWACDGPGLFYEKVK